MIDDDYCICYTVTMVDVRGCTRPPRLLDHQPISERPNIPVPPRPPDQAHTSEHTDISRQPRSLCRQFSTSTSIGELCHVVIECMDYIACTYIHNIIWYAVYCIVGYF